MSYSRWGNSRWYTYDDVAGIGLPKDEQVFTVCGEGSFTYREVRDNMEACIEKVAGEASPEELEELREYMHYWMRDVDREFGKE